MIWKPTWRVSIVMNFCLVTPACIIEADQGRNDCKYNGIVSIFLLGYLYYHHLTSAVQFLSCNKFELISSTPSMH